MTGETMQFKIKYLLLICDIVVVAPFEELCFHHGPHMPFSFQQATVAENC
jgi:hypothetical protein